MEVKFGEYIKALDRWNNVTKVPFDNDRSFHKFIDCDSFTDIGDTATQRIRLLNGPHYRAIIKAYLARVNHV